ncbi:MAG: DNA mismatch repair protein [Polyangiaceae bacterium]|nr:DNA mismatch repair protein [Polyangiaceae bacterium]
MRQALVFGFAAGGPQEAFDDVIAASALPPSTWRRASFARDLYVDEIVEKCFALRVAGKTPRAVTRYLGRVVSAPPADRADADTRRGVLGELAASPAARRDLERCYLAIVKIRGLLCAPRQPAPRVRRVEILRATRESFEALAGSFEGSATALARARAFGAAVVESEAFRRLVAYLDHDENMGAVDLRVRVGADGEVRAMELFGVHENRDNPFHVPALTRFLTRLALLFRGFRMTRGEIAERLLSDVFSGLEEGVTLLFQLLGDIEVYLGALAFRDRALEQGLGVSLADVAAAGEPLELAGLFNPLLLASGVAPVPCDVRAGPRAITVVTGPNSGGKTRLLQSVAIAQLLAEAGLFVPARVARVPHATGLFASLFEEAHADQKEGHLGMELLRIRRMFDELDADALVVIDELCSGTNPSEGEEIARLVLSLLPELGVRAFVTTHLLQFAAGLARESAAGLEFLQVELDDERPTYQFVGGVAKTSLAQRTAARLGVTRDELLARIRAKRKPAFSP